MGKTRVGRDVITTRDMCLGYNKLPHVQGLFGLNTGYLIQFTALLTALARVGSKYRQWMQAEGA
jgi:hypothetical protein